MSRNCSGTAQGPQPDGLSWITGVRNFAIFSDLTENVDDTECEIPPSQEGTHKPENPRRNPQHGALHGHVLLGHPTVKARAPETAGLPSAVNHELADPACPSTCGSAGHPSQPAV